MVVIKEKILEPEEIRSKESYLTHVNWLNEEEAIVMWIDRYQNSTTIATCSALTKWRCKTVVNIVEKIKVEEFQDLITIEKTSKSFMRIPNPEYISSNYYSIAYFNHNVSLEKKMLIQLSYLLLSLSFYLFRKTLSIM